ncbi:MAG: hypothetical protein COB51_10800, partial [Moraxellaceae bacterium]
LDFTQNGSAGTPQHHTQNSLGNNSNGNSWNGNQPQQQNNGGSFVPFGQRAPPQQKPLDPNRYNAFDRLGHRPGNYAQQGAYQHGHHGHHNSLGMRPNNGNGFNNNANVNSNFGGGGMFLALGMVSAILNAKETGLGQVIDAAMVDGASLLSASFFGQLAAGKLHEGRGEHPLNGASHYYDAYECADGEYVSIASVEPQFYEELKQLLGLTEEDFGEQSNYKLWPTQKAKIKALFLTRTQLQWCELLQQSDVCFAPVLRFEQVADHPHHRARQSFVEIEGVVQPAPAPRFSDTKSEISRPPAKRGEHTDEILLDWGYSKQDIADLYSSQAIEGLS